MKQVWISAKGAPETLQLRETADPRAGAGELRIRTAFAGINFADIQARMGQYPDAPPVPCVVGYEVSGIVDQVGQGVSGFSPGDRVLTFTRFGGYSDTVVVDASWVHKVPAGISLQAAAAVPVNYATAWTMLVRLGSLQPGETVLIHSAGGGVGIAALQICQWRGASAIGTASAGKHQRLRELGYAHCIDYRSQDFEREVMRFTAGRGVDVVLDPQGGNSFRKSYRCLAPLGRLFMFGVADSVQGERMQPLALLRALVTTPVFHPLSLLNNNRGVFGTNMGRLFGEFDRLTPDLAEIVRLLGEGTLAPVVDKVFPLEQAAAAHHYIQERRNFGKVLLSATAESE
ncbi:MAG: zinc-binding dehydrogenase [Pseudomonadales bacterium]|nr:zinc-binding dehydrogenase [Pseudomonadales bacterium]